MRSRIFPWIGGAGLAACAAALGASANQDIVNSLVYVLIGTMLFYPLLDRQWRPPGLPKQIQNGAAWGVLILTAAALFAWKPIYLGPGLSTLFTAALPEEWFFRAYFMTSLGSGLPANLVASILFSVLHGLTKGWVMAVQVFVPSLFYGWIYQRTRDLPLLVLTHALSNIVFMMFIANFLTKWFGIS